MPSFGAQSAERLATCNIRLRLLFERIVQYRDCTILSGHREQAEQDKLFKAKASKVRWPNSKHNAFPSNAVDVAPWPIPKKWGADEMKELVKFYEFAGIVKYEARRMDLNIRWGGDWDGDGDYTDQKFDDLVHFELA